MSVFQASQEGVNAIHGVRNQALSWQVLLATVGAAARKLEVGNSERGNLPSQFGWYQPPAYPSIN